VEWRLSIVHYRAFDHRIYGVAEYLNVSLAFSPSSFSSSCSSFSFFLSHMFKDRHCVIVARLSLYRAHAGAVNDLSQRFDNRLKIFVQYHVLFDSTFRVRCFLRISLVFSISLATFSHIYPCSSLAKYRQGLVTLRYRKFH